MLKIKKYKEMFRNARKCLEMQANVRKCKEIQKMKKNVRKAMLYREQQMKL